MNTGILGIAQESKRKRERQARISVKSAKKEGKVPPKMKNIH